MYKPAAETRDSLRKVRTMRFVFYAFAFAAVGLFWMNTSPSGQSVKKALFAHHTPEWKGN